MGWLKALGQVAGVAGVVLAARALDDLLTKTDEPEYDDEYDDSEPSLENNDRFRNSRRLNLETGKWEPA